MAEWKKVILSGSAAELASLSLDTPLTVPNGGTGAATLTDGGVLLGSGTGAITAMAVLANGEMIVGDGSTDPVAESGATLRTSIGVGTADNVEFANLVVNEIINDSTVAATMITGSFTGSFVGDGSQLTGLTSAAITSYLNPGDNRIVAGTSTSTEVEGQANLTFDGSTLNITGNTIGSGTGSFGLVSGSRLSLGNVAAGTDDTVLILLPGGEVRSDEIDSRVWGTSLVDGAGVATRLAYWSDPNTLTSDADLTFDGSILTVQNSTFGTNTVIAGDLTVLGDTIHQNISNVLVEDRFALFNSGSASGDGGIIVQTETNFEGVVLGWDDSATRWSIQKSVTLSHSASAIASEAYVAAVIDEDGGLTDIAAFQQNGNIRVSGSDIYIYA